MSVTLSVTNTLRPSRPSRNVRHMDYPDRRHSDCTIAHLGLAGCRECMRLYDLDRAGDTQPRSAPPKPSKRHVSSGASRGGDITDDAPSKIGRKRDEAVGSAIAPENSHQSETRKAHSPPDGVVAVSDGVALGSKPDRLAVAKQALSDAARAARYRKNKKKTDPDWMKREAARKRAKRRRERG